MLVFLCFFGIFICPTLTLAIILFKFGHPILGVFALVKFISEMSKEEE